MICCNYLRISNSDFDNIKYSHQAIYSYTVLSGYISLKNNSLLNLILFDINISTHASFSL